jgi:glycosyltransferase involved in cell wall biosynthesis
MVMLRVTFLKIALISFDYPPDPKGTGIGTYTKYLAHYLTERGHFVHVITRGLSTQDETSSVGKLTLHRIGIPRPTVPMEINALEVSKLALSSIGNELRYRRRIAQKIEHLIQTENIQLIESAESFAESYFYQPQKHPHIPFIIKLHTPFAVGELFDKNLPEPLRHFVRSIERRLILKASHLTVPSYLPKKLFQKEMGLGNRPIRVLPNPPPLGLTNKPESQEAEPPEVLFVGRVTAFKGVFVLAKAIPNILEQHPNARFIFVGSDNPNPKGGGSTIEALKASLPEKCTPNVTFTGHVKLEDVSQYYQRAAVCVFPSLFENFPYTCLEAMSYGKAIVGSSNGGMTDLLDNENCGLLYDPPDAQDLAQKIMRLLEDKPLRDSYGQKARQRALDHFCAEHVMDLTEEFYFQALKDCQ